MNPRKHQIIYLHPHFTAAGGAGEFVIQTANRLADRGHEIHVVCIRADAWAKEAFDSRISIHPIGGPLSSKFGFWFGFRSSVSKVETVLRKISKDNDVDSKVPVLFPQVFPANWWAGSLRKRFQHWPFVWFCQEPSAFIHSRAWMAALPFPKNYVARLIRPIFKMIDCAWMAKMDMVLANSHFTLDYAYRVYGKGGPRENFGNAVTLGTNQPAVPNLNSNTDHERSGILLIAKLTRFKNAEQVIRSMTQLPDDGSLQHLHVVGDGDDRARLENLTQELQLNSRVTFHGRIDESSKQSLLRNCRVSVLASRDEPFGLVVIEALAAGMPVVAVNSGGPAEILGDSPAGHLIDAPEPKQIAAAIQKLGLAEDYSERSQLARQRAQRYNWETTVDELERSFNTAVEQVTASVVQNGGSLR